MAEPQFSEQNSRFASDDGAVLVVAVEPPRDTIDRVALAFTYATDAKRQAMT